MSDERSKWAFLGALKFWLACVVLVGHFDYLPGQHPWTRMGLFFNQGSAVYGWFLLAGYSMAARLERSPSGYFAWRFRAVWPTYLVSLSMGIVLAASLSRPVTLGSLGIIQPLVLVDLIVALTMTQGFLTTSISADGQIWALAIEWWSSMLAPMLRRCATLALVPLIFVSLSLLIVTGVPSNPGLSSGGHMFIVLFWLWLVGFLYFRHEGTSVGYVLLFVPAILVARFGWIGYAAMVALIAIAVSAKVKLPERLHAPFGWLGDLSFPLYQVHQPILFGCWILGVYSPGLIALICLIVGAIVLHTVDLPMRLPCAPGPLSLESL